MLNLFHRIKLNHNERLSAIKLEQQSRVLIDHGSAINDYTPTIESYNKALIKGSKAFTKHLAYFNKKHPLRAADPILEMSSIWKKCKIATNFNSYYLTLYLAINDFLTALNFIKIYNLWNSGRLSNHIYCPGLTDNLKIWLDTIFKTKDLQLSKNRQSISIEKHNHLLKAISMWCLKPISKNEWDSLIILVDKEKSDLFNKKANNND